MIRIDDEARYRPEFWDPEQRLATLNRWGPLPPQSFLA